MERRYYSEYLAVEDRHWWFVGRRRIFLRLLDRYLDPAGRSRRILDVGCGTGSMMGHLARYGEVEGMDTDTQAVAMCHRRGLARVRHVESLPLPWEDGTFDLVTALDVLEHADDDRALLLELKRVTRPGGLLLISVPAFNWLWGAQDVISHHKRRYVAPELEERVSEAGLDLRHLSYFNTLLFPPVAAIRLLRAQRRALSEVRSDFELTRPGRLNDLLGRIFGAEAGAVERFRLPFGVSIAAVAARPDGAR